MAALPDAGGLAALASVREDALVSAARGSEYAGESEEESVSEHSITSSLTEALSMEEEDFGRVDVQTRLQSDALCRRAAEMWIIAAKRGKVGSASAVQGDGKQLARQNQVETEKRKALDVIADLKGEPKWLQGWVKKLIWEDREGFNNDLEESGEVFIPYNLKRPRDQDALYVLEKQLRKQGRSLDHHLREKGLIQKILAAERDTRYIAEQEEETRLAENEQVTRPAPSGRLREARTGPSPAPRAAGGTKRAFGCFSPKRWCGFALTVQRIR